MADQSRVRWGIIGCGRFGRVHAQAIRSLPNCELVAICNRNAERLKEATAEFQVPHSHVDYQQMLDDPDVDAVSITTHWRDHAAVALAALESGKHVLLEKPMAATVEECDALLAAAHLATGLFMVGHVCRFDPRISLAKEAIDAGRIGRVVSMHAKRNLPRAPGNIRLNKISPLMGDGVHDADLMMWFLGKRPQRVYGRNVRFEQHVFPEVGWAMLEFGEDAVGVVETNWGLPTNVPTVIDAILEVVGTAGMLKVDCAHTGLTVLDGDGPKCVDTHYWPQSHGRLVGVLRDEISYFADCVEAGTAPNVITPEEAARAVEVMAAAERSAASGQPVLL
jgi:UDP-N-acetylglucosamine 3-dehydrogenase